MSTGYNINKTTFARFFTERLGNTMPNLLVKRSTIGGNEANPTMYLIVDNKEVAKNRASDGSLPKPIAISIVASTDGHGGGYFSSFMYNVTGFGRERLFDNSNHNLKAWGYSVADNASVSSNKKTVQISDFNVCSAGAKLIEDIRVFCKTIGEYTV